MGTAVIERRALVERMGVGRRGVGTETQGSAVAAKQQTGAVGFEAADVETAQAEAAGGIGSRGFVALLMTQFLGAMNDNILRWLVVPIGKYVAGPEHEALALSAGLACFVLPYLVLAAPAGYLADRFSKRTVMIACKWAEVAIMIGAVGAIWFQSMWLLFAVVALMGSQSALFGPSKYGSIPDLVRGKSLTAANGLVSMTTLVAVIVGTMIGGYLYLFTGPAGVTDLWISALVLVGVSVVGLAASFGIAQLPAANPRRVFPRNVVRQVWRDLGMLSSRRALLRVALGGAFFWTLASVSNLNIDAFGTGQLGLEQQEIGLLLGVMTLAVAAGNLFAGFASRGRIELGFVPVGAAGMAVGSMMLYTTAESYAATCVWLAVVGFFGGMFDVPQQAYLQQHSPRGSRGSIMAAANFLSFGGMLLASGLYWVLRTPLGMSASDVFLLAGVMSVPVAAYAVWVTQRETFQFCVAAVAKLFYRMRVTGVERVPERGGALLVANHVSWIDGAVLMLTTPRPIRMVGYADYFERGVGRWLAQTFGVIPIKPGAGRAAVTASLRTAREAIRNGELVCIFPEGGITRDGDLKEFRPGMRSIVKGTGAPVIPVYLGGLWGSIFSYCGGTMFAKFPRRWRFPISVRFGCHLTEADDVGTVRQAVQQLGVEDVSRENKREANLLELFVRQQKKSLFRSKAADTMGRDLTGGKVLSGALVFRRLLSREVLGKDEKFVGLLIPPSVPSVLANVALPLDGRTAVNLNYTVSSKVMNACIRQCGIKHVLTSKKVMKKLNLEIDAELVYLEDLITKVSVLDKLIGAAQAYAMPAWLIEKIHGLDKIQPDDLLTVLFTSGSTGEPKGVMLTHRNVGSNVRAIDEVVSLSHEDVAAGVLPFFHSYGYTATLWTMMALAPKAVYHVNPLEAKEVGEMCSKHGANILMATPTFLRTYLKRCQPEHFAKLDVVFASAERLPKELSDAFETKFGVRPMEAYGATEMSPLIAVNVPPSRTRGSEEQGAKEGSVGRPVPGVKAKIVHPESGEDVPLGESGMLLVKGASRMAGYYERPDLTAEVFRDEWYVTGDIAKLDAGGFITITGRESRFSKIGGEMVPHIKIEETLREVLKIDPDEVTVAVAAVPDEKKGERLVVLYTELSESPAEAGKRLKEAGLPNLWVPAADCFFPVDEIPVLGTGKLDLKALKEAATECASGLAPS